MTYTDIQRTHYTKTQTRVPISLMHKTMKITYKYECENKQKISETTYSTITSFLRNINQVHQKVILFFFKKFTEHLAGSFFIDRFVIERAAR